VILVFLYLQEEMNTNKTDNVRVNVISRRVGLTIFVVGKQ